MKNYVFYFLFQSAIVTLLQDRARILSPVEATCFKSFRKKEKFQIIKR